ncbi:hypothetical protein [Agrobacterium tumefaciens]|uniref:hypothetical protein n=1 Tax=Agrobacterium tumefaciens TaxID=358 RepID=UPI001571B273|nr:hypothetical protein [Agrobacterium tumefaciens]WCK21765.1 hypothetical protein G6M09_022530 [Agrobacterium tumefaciens]
MFADWKEEREIRRTLRKLARQRVALILQPGNTKVIERALGHDDKTDAILLTCEMRGWVEVMQRAVPQGSITKDQRLPDGPMFDRVGDIYKFTDSGWNAINRAHGWTVFTGFLGFVSILATFAVTRL